MQVRELSLTSKTKTMKNTYIGIAFLFILLQACGTSKEEGNNNPVLLSDTAHIASSVFLAKDENNTPVISWIEKDSEGTPSFYFAKWDADKEIFSGQKNIPIEQNASIHAEGMPKIAVKGDGTVIAIYETSTPLENSRFGLGDIRFVSSVDGGHSWSAPQSIQSENVQAVSRSFSGIQRLDDGEVGVSYLGTHLNKEIEGRPVLFAKTNQDHVFEKETLIDSTACECCRTALSSNGLGKVHLVYRDLLPGSIRDISVSHSDNLGLSFSAPTPFSADQWKVEGCPHNGPSVVSSHENTYIVWFSAGTRTGISYAELNKNNKIISKIHLNPNGKFAQISLLPDNSRLVVYDAVHENKGGVSKTIIINRIKDNEVYEKEIKTITGKAMYPVAESISQKKAVIAWEEEGKIYYTPLKTKGIPLKNTYEK